ncbi:MAG: sensor histidine kinase [Clostridia bacterium]|nr:sensor histidine kinase [Clostridia bacterium]
MKELSLNVLDIVENSTKAGATRVEIQLRETPEKFTLAIVDDGCGMDEETVRSVTDPFYTTRTTRKVGMGIPLLKLAAEQTGGSLTITSRPQTQWPDDHGTTVTAVFDPRHIDFTPLGDIVSSFTTLIQGHPDVDFLLDHRWEGGQAVLDTAELRPILGEDVPLNTYEVIQWIAENLKEQYGDREKEILGKDRSS